ncbi:hypothetical protein V5E97_07030 [Singulisphaera sp. Ch08]|uniref:Uncharacterized protein n=1 Tax=Singulisphaera sp. Ch08 TaxID=3120278 RepID=A0AAU7CL83_9BACT
MSDQSGWRINHQAIVARQTGQIVWSMPFNPSRWQERGPRKVLDTGRLIALAAEKGRYPDQKG